MRDSILLSRKLSSENFPTDSKGPGRPLGDTVKGSLGEQVRNARIKAGLSQAELGERVGLKVGMISKGELQSDFSKSVLILLVREFLTSFSDPALERYLRLEDYFVKVFQLLTKLSKTPFQDFAELLKELEHLTLSERVERLREWLEHAQGNLQENHSGQLPSNVVKLATVHQTEPQTTESRFEPMVEYVDPHTQKRAQHKQVQKRRKRR